VCLRAESNRRDEWSKRQRVFLWIIKGQECMKTKVVLGQKIQGSKENPKSPMEFINVGDP